MQHIAPVNEKHLVIGLGEVGKAIQQVFNAAGFDLGTRDLIDSPDFMHICFPWSDDFFKQVREYQEQYRPVYTIVHSTVPVGTCSCLDAIHSPIRGRHPDLYQSVKTFVKFVGGLKGGPVAEEFRRHGLRVILFDKQESTELGKLLETEYYRACIEFTHRAKELSVNYEVPFHEAYTLFNQTYNEGYQAMGNPEYTRPILQPIPGPIGGHCVTPNSKLI